MKKLFFLLLVACVLSVAVPGMSLSAETRTDTATESGDAEVFVDDSDRFTAEVAAYAKGIDIIFVAADRKMTRAEFTAMASRSVREFKGRFGIDRAMPVGAVLDYQKDAASDTRTRFMLKLR